MENNVHKAGSDFSNLDWPDGWFVFERGIVKGPFSTHETFARKTKEDDSYSFMVSRKGFGCWYALKDLASVYYQAERIGVSHLASVKDIEETLSGEINRLAAIESGITDQRRAALSELDKTARENSQAPLSARKGPVQQKRPAKDAVALANRPKEEMEQKDDSPIPENQLGRATLGSRRVKLPDDAEHSEISGDKGISERPTPKLTRAGRDRQLAYNHMVLAGRLRLGNLSNPWIEAYAKFFVALGLYWGIWVRRAVIAVAFHIDGALVQKSTRFFWLALIPGYHMILTHRLATAIATMERQNGYQETSPTKAMWLAIFPPWAIFYLQSAMTKHWQLHVKHES